MLNAFWEAHTALSPGGLITIALNDFQRAERDFKLQQQDLALLARDLGQLDMKIEGPGRISLTLSREQFLGFIRNYLVARFLGEGSARSDLVALPNSKDYDASLGLPSRTIFVKLGKDPLDEHTLELELESAKAVNPSEVWIFAYYETEERDIRLDPSFVSENRILYGHLRVIPASQVMREATGGRFFAFVLGKRKDFPESNLSQEDSVRFLLVKDVASA